MRTYGSISYFTYIHFRHVAAGPKALKKRGRAGADKNPQQLTPDAISARRGFVGKQKEGGGAGSSNVSRASPRRG